MGPARLGSQGSRRGDCNQFQNAGPDLLKLVGEIRTPAAADAERCIGNLLRGVRCRTAMVFAAPPRNGKAPYPPVRALRQAIANSTIPHFASTMTGRSAPHRPAWFPSQCQTLFRASPPSAAVLSMIADTAGLDVEYYVVGPAMAACVPAQGRARHEQDGRGAPNMAHRTFNPAQRPPQKGPGYHRHRYPETISHQPPDNR